MNKVVKFLLLIAAISLVLIQFIPTEKPDNNSDSANDLIHLENVPQEIAGLLKAGCYDCHSEKVNYPWYTSVAPISWLVIRDVRLGREELNLSQWGQLSKRKKIKTLTSMAEEIEDDEMPLPIYTIMHSAARFNDEQRSALITWADKLSSEIMGE